MRIVEISGRSAIRCLDTFGKLKRGEFVNLIKFEFSGRFWCRQKNFDTREALNEIWIFFDAFSEINFCLREKIKWNRVAQELLALQEKKWFSLMTDFVFWLWNRHCIKIFHLRNRFKSVSSLWLVYCSHLLLLTFSAFMPRILCCCLWKIL